MQRVKIPIRPGGMLADATENKLGSDQHVEVKNFKEVKVDEWEIVKGYIRASKAFAPGVVVAAAAEVTDDLSGDRFIIYFKSNNAELRRLDYDISNSPLTGYENESSSILTAPTGVTLTVNDTIRFFIHNGVVRITGGSEPIWYGYVKRKLLYTGFMEIDKLDFETASDVNNFTASNCTIAQSAAYAKYGSNSMLITSTGAGAYALRTLGAAKTGAKYRIYCHGNKGDAGTPNTEDWFIKVGTTAGGDEIKVTQHQADNTVSWRECYFEFDVPEDWDNATTAIYISIFPETRSGTGDTLYIDEWNLVESYAQSNFQGWYLEKTALDKFDLTDIIVLNNWPVDEDGSAGYRSFIKIAPIYDRSQYGLGEYPRVISNVVNSPAYDLTAGEVALGQKINLRLSGLSILASTHYPNMRLTGFLVLLGSVVTPLGENDDSLVWRVVETLDFVEHPPTIDFLHDKVRYESATPKRIFLRDTGEGADYHSHWEDGYLQVGAYIYLAGENGRLFTKITAVSVTGAAVQDYIDVADDVYPRLITVADVDTNLSNVSMEIMRLYSYGALDGIDTNIGVEVTGGTNFWDFTSIPSGTIHNTPDYSHHRVINNIAYVLSNEDDEQDIIRYAPENQPDNFPILQLITTPVGDIDRNLALVERDGRFVTLKRKSVAQGQFTANSYFHDKDGVAHGLYATEGYIVIDDVLYFMDIDDIYMFNGVQVQPFMQNSLMRTYYIDNVSTGSFFAYKPLSKEMWIVLNGIIIVYDFERRSFYLRQTTLTPVNGFTDYDQRLFLFSTSKFTLFDHSETTFDESIYASFRTGLKDLTTPENYKKLHKIYPRIKCSEDITITFTDDNETTTPFSTNVACNPNRVAVIEGIKPLYLFKEGHMEVLADSAYDLLGTIKTFDLNVHRWKGEP